jgi:hypothetical protein
LTILIGLHWNLKERKKKTSSIEIFVADSNFMENANLLLNFENIKKASFNFLLLATRTCINDKLIPVTTNEMSIDQKNNIWYSFFKKVCKITQASFLIKQSNTYDCAICCLQRMERIMISPVRSAELNKNTPPELKLSSRQFRLVILQRLIPDDISEICPELRNIIEEKKQSILISDVHELGFNDIGLNNCEEAETINRTATLLQGDNQNLPMDNSDVSYNNKSQHDYPIENDILPLTTKHIVFPVENDVQNITQHPCVPVEGPINDAVNDVGRLEETPGSVTNNETSEETPISEINNEKTTMHIGKVPKPEYKALRNEEDNTDNIDDIDSGEESTYLPKRGPNEPIIRTDLNSDENSNSEYDDNGDDDTLIENQNKEIDDKE